MKTYNGMNAGSVIFIMLVVLKFYGLTDTSWGWVVMWLGIGAFVAVWNEVSAWARGINVQ